MANSEKNGVLLNLKKSFRNKKALILGGMGFIGSSLAIRLVELGAEVTIADAMIEEYGGNLFNINRVNEGKRPPESNPGLPGLEELPGMSTGRAKKTAPCPGKNKGGKSGIICGHRAADKTPHILRSGLCRSTACAPHTILAARGEILQWYAGASSPIPSAAWCCLWHTCGHARDDR